MFLGENIRVPGERKLSVEAVRAFKFSRRFYFLLYNQKDQVVDFFVNVMKSTVWLLCSILYFHLAAK